MFPKVPRGVQPSPEFAPDQYWGILQFTGSARGALHNAVNRMRVAPTLTVHSGRVFNPNDFSVVRATQEVRQQTATRIGVIADAAIRPAFTEGKTILDGSFDAEANAAQLDAMRVAHLNDDRAASVAGQSSSSPEDLVTAARARVAQTAPTPMVSSLDAIYAEAA
jgi:hypothetical protein